MTTMNVSRALAEIKRIDDRIQRAINEGSFVAVTTGKSTSMKVWQVNAPVDATKSKIQEWHDKMEAMFVSRSAIKAAIIASNAATKVIIGSKTVTVAEAIEMKTSVIYKKQLLQVLKSQFNKCNSDVTMLNQKLDDTIEANLKTIYGSDKSKADSSAYEAIAKPQREQKEAALLDPKDIQKKIESLTEEIAVISTELDYILSTSNAITVIEVV